MEKPGGIPGDPLEGGDTEPNAIELDDADIEEIDSGAVTVANRVCSECSGPVLGIGVIEPPELDVLRRLPIYWQGCVHCGPVNFPSWWFCARGGTPTIGPGEGDGIFGVTGSYRVFVKRLVTRS